MRATVNNSKKSKSSTIYTIAFYIKFALLGNYALVFWEDENSVSVLCGDVRPHAEIGSQPHSTVDVGSLCNVTMNASVYKGKVAAKGTTMYIDLKLGEMFCHFYCVREACLLCREACLLCREACLLCREACLLCRKACLLCREACLLCREACLLCREACLLCREACLLCREACLLCREACLLCKEPCLLCREPCLLMCVDWSIKVFFYMYTLVYLLTHSIVVNTIPYRYKGGNEIVRKEIHRRGLHSILFHP